MKDCKIVKWQQIQPKRREIVNQYKLHSNNCKHKKNCFKTWKKTYFYTLKERNHYTARSFDNEFLNIYRNYSNLTLLLINAGGQKWPKACN